MTVYVEIVFLNNFFIDLLLCISTIFSRRRKLRKLRIIASAIIGAVVSVAYAFMPAVFKVLTKVLLAPILTITFDKYKSVKDYIMSLGLFVIFTFVLGGSVYGLCHMAGIDLRGYAVLGVLAFAIVFLEGVLWFVVVKKPNSNKTYYDVAVTYKGKVLWLKGFYDSGNTLTDSFSGFPVVLLGNSAVKMLQEFGELSYEGFVEVKSINGESSMPIISLDEVRCGQMSYNCFGAITGQDVKDCDLILQNTLVYK